MGGEACLVILAALSSSGAEEGYLTRVCCEGGRSAVQASAGPRNRTGRGVWLLDLPGNTGDRRDERGGQVYPTAEMAKEWAVGTR